jgi:uncharacterized protein (DUF3084 family)
MKTDIFDDMFDVAGALKDVNVETSKDLSSLVSQVQEVNDQLADAEQEVKRLGKVKYQLETERIPALMEEMGQTKGTWNGVEVKLVQKIDARISEANKDAAFSWLRDNGHDGIIKNELLCPSQKERIILQEMRLLPCVTKVLIRYKKLQFIRAL